MSTLDTGQASTTDKASNAILWGAGVGIAAEVLLGVGAVGAAVGAIVGWNRAER